MKLVENKAMHRVEVGVPRVGEGILGRGGKGSIACITVGLLSSHKFLYLLLRRYLRASPWVVVKPWAFCSVVASLLFFCLRGTDETW